MALHTLRNDLTGLSLCAGVGGLELGVHIAEPNYRTVCYVEREAFPAATLVARMEDQTVDKAPVWDDVTTFDGQAWRGKVHILTAGYPCQPFSFAGRRKGEQDPRHLWPHVSRIIEEIDPEWCFFENVEGHMSLGADDVIRDLQRLGFTVKAGLFSALECGASHIRRRLFIMAHADKVPILQQDRIAVGQRLLCDEGRSEPSGQPIGFGEGGASLDAYMDVDEGLWGTADETLQLPLHLTLNAGPRFSINDLSFNPNFSDWIMGWPIGLTDPMRPVTGWSAWLQRMRGELLRMPT